MTHRRGGIAAAIVCVLALAAPLAGSADAATYREIESTGPIQSIALGDELSCQVAYVNDIDFEFYPPDTTPGDCGTAIAVNGVLYAPDFESHGRSATWELDGYVPFTPVSQTGVLGTGSAADPYRLTTVVDAGSSGLRISETTSYTTGSNTYRIDISVTNRGSGSPTAVLYHAGDCYASGSDIGFGFTRTEVSTAGCSQSAQNSPAGRTVQMAPLSAGSQFYEARYDEVWKQIATKAPFPNTCRCGEHIDNGVGLSWALGFEPFGSTVRSLAVSFTESTPPAPGADSDGDALPDNWETGSAPSGGYENLAPLGADPHRKDVFVQLDYMAGCKPPKGWELDAIRVFKEHGIALHVDSGPDSINADGQPWGARSAVTKALDKQNDITLWDAFDRLKDTNFVPSNRRRAFHYAALVNEFNGDDGGLSREIPEADFIFTGCSVPDWLELGLKNYITTVFVHELGHNLGLRHGGGDNTNGKPNYYGIMNYGWTVVGGIGKDGMPGERPEYSRSARPQFDENHVDERVPQVLPVAWNCPGHDRFDFEYKYGEGTGLVDWNCNHVYGEGPYEANLNSTWGSSKGILTGFNDWRALRFDGGSVLGDFDLPERPRPPVVHELTLEEFAAAQKARKRSRRESRRQLVVEANRHRLRPGRVAVLRIRVDVATGKRKAGGATLSVRGARLIGAPSSQGRPDRRGRVRPNRGDVLRTDRRGRAQLRLLPGKRGDVRIFASKRGFTRGGLVLTVKGNSKPKKHKHKR
jgi:hypothetical protein